MDAWIPFSYDYIRNILFFWKVFRLQIKNQLNWVHRYIYSIKNIQNSNILETLESLSLSLRCYIRRLHGFDILFGLLWLLHRNWLTAVGIFQSKILHKLSVALYAHRSATEMINIIENFNLDSMQFDAESCCLRASEQATIVASFISAIR